MKKRYLLLLPIFLLIAGSFVTTTKAQTVNDPQGDIIGIHTWTEGSEQEIDCDWMPAVTDFFDISSIEWAEAGDNYTVTMSFYGETDIGYIDNGTVTAALFFLINGTSYPDDLEEQFPHINGWLEGSC